MIDMAHSIYLCPPKDGPHACGFPAAKKKIGKGETKRKIQCPFRGQLVLTSGFKYTGRPSVVEERGLKEEERED